MGKKAESITGSYPQPNFTSSVLYQTPAQCVRNQQAMDPQKMCLMRAMKVKWVWQRVESLNSCSSLQRERKKSKSVGDADFCNLILILNTSFFHAQSFLCSLAQFSCCFSLYIGPAHSRNLNGKLQSQSSNHK